MYLYRRQSPCPFFNLLSRLQRYIRLIALNFNPIEYKIFFTLLFSKQMNNQLGLVQLQQVFNYKIKVKVKELYYLFIFNSYRLYITIEFIKYCNNNRIFLAIYLFYLTYTLQPLNIYLFKPLLSTYFIKLITCIYKCQGISAIIKRDFFYLFYKA